MTAHTVKETIAPLRNVALFASLMDRVMNRSSHLPGMATFHGYSGYGKTWSATYAAHRYRARYVEVGESWTKKKFLSSLCIEVGIPVPKTMPDMVEALIEAIAIDGRPVIVDEFDWVMKRGYFETVREIHDKTDVPFVLIGEELLPSKLKSASERFHNRILDWVAAEPADLDDMRHLARLYHPNLSIDEELLRRIDAACHGRIRRICVNLDRLRERAQALGTDEIGPREWGDAPFFTGQPPARRVG